MMTSRPFMSNTNAQQLEAIEIVDGSLLTIAGPGDTTPTLSISFAIEEIEIGLGGLSPEVCVRTPSGAEG